MNNIVVYEILSPPHVDVALALRRRWRCRRPRRVSSTCPRAALRVYYRVIACLRDTTRQLSFRSDTVVRLWD